MTVGVEGEVGGTGGEGLVGSDYRFDNVGIRGESGGAGRGDGEGFAAAGELAEGDGEAGIEDLVSGGARIAQGVRDEFDGGGFTFGEGDGSGIPDGEGDISGDGGVRSDERVGCDEAREIIGSLNDAEGSGDGTAVVRIVCFGHDGQCWIDNGAGEEGLIAVSQGDDLVGTGGDGSRDGGDNIEFFSRMRAQAGDVEIIQSSEEGEGLIHGVLDVDLDIGLGVSGNRGIAGVDDDDRHLDGLPAARNDACLREFHGSKVGGNIDGGCANALDVKGEVGMNGIGGADINGCVFDAGVFGVIGDGQVRATA